MVLSQLLGLGGALILWISGSDGTFILFFMYCCSNPREKELAPPASKNQLSPNNIEEELRSEPEAIICNESRFIFEDERRSRLMFYLLNSRCYRGDKCFWELVENLEYVHKLLKEFQMAFPRILKL